VSDTHSLILRNHRPQTGLEGKFSMEFAMASAVIARRAGLAEYTDGFVRRPEVQDLMRRVGHRNQPELRSGGLRSFCLGPGPRRPDGRSSIESEKVRRAKGHADRPTQRSRAFSRNFRTCLDAGRAQIVPDVLFDRLKHLESLSARELASVG